jgi:propanol-preferring alcohol dehydrogenase
VRVDHDYPVPEPKDDEILVRLTSSGVCHSDLSIIMDHWGVRDQITMKVPGHEGSGYVVKHGTKVDTSKYPIGTRVGVALVSNPCRDCDVCRIEDGEVKCLNAPFHGTGLDGTWCQYMNINSRYVIPIPDGPDEHLVGPILCGGLTVYKGLKHAQVRAGEWVVITGAGGGLGTLAVQYANAMGYRVIAIDTGAEKQELVSRLGAEEFVDFKTDDVVAKINQITKIGAHAAIMIAPSASVYNQAPLYLRFKGSMVCISLPPNGADFSVPPGLIVHKCLRIVGSFVGTRSDALEALDFLARNKVSPPVKLLPMEDISNILNDMHNGTLSGRAVIDLH